MGKSVGRNSSGRRESELDLNLLQWGGSVEDDVAVQDCYDEAGDEMGLEGKT